MYLTSKNILPKLIVVAIASFLVTSMASASTTAALLPSGEGTFLSWTPKSGTVHYTSVDESACNGVTDYVTAATVGNRDSYVVSLASVPDGATITNIAVTPCASRNTTGSGTSVLDVFYRYNGAQSADAGAYSLPTGTTPVTLTTTNFSGLSLNKTISSSLEVGAVYTSGTKGIRLSQLATVITYTPLTPPAAPTSLVGSAVGTTSVSLAWTDNASNETAFSIERSTNNVTFSAVASTSANVTTFNNTGLSGGTYYYRVRAYNAAGYSAYSGTTVVTLPTKPAAPSNLIVASTTSSSANLAWTDNSSNETSFSLERSSNNITFAQVASTSANVTTFNNTGLSGGTYYYRVRALNAAGYSAYSSTTAVTIYPGPTAPSNLTVTATTTSSVSLAWTDNSSNENGFSLERSTNNITFAAIATTSPNVATYVNTGMATGTYYYRVRAFNGLGVSAYSNTRLVILR